MLRAGGVSRYNDASYQYKDPSHYNDKVVPWQPYLYNGNPNTWEDGLYNKTGHKSSTGCMVTMNVQHAHILLGIGCQQPVLFDSLGIL